jgi:nucleoside-diphosphate kinase
MNQQTLVLIKPDGVERNLIGTIISYYEKAGLKVVKMKLMTADRDLISKHYPEDEAYMETLGKKSEAAGDKIENYVEQGRKIVLGLRDYITSGPIVAMVLEGEEAIPLVRKVTGYTDPATAEKGTIRGDLGQDTILAANAENRPVKNLIHASGNPEEAEAEIKLWFPS